MPGHTERKQVIFLKDKEEFLVYLMIVIRMVGSVGCAMMYTASMSVSVDKSNTNLLRGALWKTGLERDNQTSIHDMIYL